MASARVVLIVDDEPLIRDVLASEFEDAGYATVEAESGAEALGVLERHETIDLLFTDIRMPGGMDGWQLAERARELRPELPVIYATGYSEEAPRLVPGGRLFKKPFRTSTLLAALVELGLSAQR